MAPDEPLPSIVRFQASATEQEIWRGALGATDAKQHVLAFFREIDNLEAFPRAAKKRDFVDVDDAGAINDLSRGALHELKQELRKRLGNNCITSTKHARLVQRTNDKGEPSLDVTDGHLEELCARTYAALDAIIRGQMNEYWGTSNSEVPPSRELELERNEHQRFCQERAPADAFIGRKRHLEAIHAYLHRDSRQPLVIHGASGCGKTALLARASQDVAQEWKTTVRFIGVTPHSSDLRSLLSSLCQELREQHPIESPLPGDLRKLILELQEHLEAATVQAPVILFLDALDQLDEVDGGPALYWIPDGPLPSHAKLIVSCLSDCSSADPARKPYATLRGRGLAEDNFINLDTLPDDDAQTLLFGTWLPQAKRKLNNDQEQCIRQRLASTTCRLPLYLKILFGEVRLWHSYTPAPRLGNNVSELLDGLFNRLGDLANHGATVKYSLSYIASARRGLTETEITEVLHQDRYYRRLLEKTTAKTTHRLPDNPKRVPIAIWSRLRFDLGPFLAEHAAPGGTVLNFYHRQVGEYVREQFLGSPHRRQKWHGRLGDYFHRQDRIVECLQEQHGQAERLPFSSRSVNARKVDELPWQRLQGEQWDEVRKLLTDLDFVDAKCRVGMVYDLVNDYQRAERAWPGQEEKRRQEVVRQADLERWQREIIEYASRWSQARSWHEHHGIALTDGKRVPLPEPPHLLDIEPDHGDSEHSGDWTSLEHIRGWRHFVANQGDQMGKDLPSPSIYQLAWNSAANGPVAETVARQPAPTKPWLRLEPRPPYNPDPSDQLVLDGHARWITSVGVTPDGRRAVSSGGHALRLWDLEKGQWLGVLDGHVNGVTSVSVTPDGHRAVSGSRDKTLRVWDLVLGECARVLDGHTSYVECVSLTADGRRAVSGGLDHTLRVWDLENGHSPRTVRGNTDCITSVSVTPDCRRAVSGGAAKTVLVWDLESGQCRRVLEGHTGGISCVGVTPNGRRAISGSADKTLRVWDLESGRCLRVLEGHTKAVASISVTPDGRRAVSGSWDATLRVWDLETGRCLRLLKGHTDNIDCVSVTPDGRRAVSGYEDHTLAVWDWEAGQCLALWGPNRADLNSMFSIASMNQIVCGSQSGLVSILRLENVPKRPATITAARLWSIGQVLGRWDDGLTAFCPACGQRFPVAPEILGLELACPHCPHLLQLNSFTSDLRDLPAVFAADPEIAAEEATDEAVRSLTDACMLRSYMADPYWHSMASFDPNHLLANPVWQMKVVDDPKTGHEMAVQANDFALKLRQQGHVEEAVEFSQRALALDEKFWEADHPLIPNRLMNLALSLMLGGRMDEALGHLQRAWEVQARRTDITTPQLLLLRLVLAWERQEPLATLGSFLGQIKTLLSMGKLENPGATGDSWPAADLDFLDHLRSKLNPERLELLAGIEAVFNGRSKAEQLSTNGEWSEAVAIPLQPSLLSGDSAD